MKTPLCTLLAIAFFCLTVMLPATHATPPELPKPGFAPELVDGVGKWYLDFDTNPGYHYTVEESENLVDWTLAPGGSFYGNGAKQKLYICDGPMTPESTSSGGSQPTGQGLWHLKTISMKLQMQSGNNGTFQRLSRNIYTPLGATDPLPAWDRALSLQLPSQAARPRYFPMLEWKDYTEHIIYWIDLHVHITDEPPPVDSLATTAEEPGELAIFDQVYSQLVGYLLTDGTAVIDNTPLPRKSARVRVTEIDVNGNGIWDWWELKFGWNPFAQPGQPGFCDPMGDPDGDGIPNYQEKIDETDPTKHDSDGDGFHDGEDDFPNDKEKHPPPVTYLITATKEVYFGSSSGGFYVNRFSNWPHDAVTGSPPPYTSPQLMVNELGQPEFPENVEGMAPKGVVLQNGYPEAGGRYEYGVANLPTPAFYSGNIKHSRVWLVHKPIEKTPVTESFLVLQKKTSTVGPTDYEPSLEVLTLEVKKDETYSDPYDLLSDFSGVPDSTQSFTVTTKTELRQIEFVQPELDEFDRRILDAEGKDKLVPVDRLRLCRWYQAFGWRSGNDQITAPDFQADFHKKDNDRFHIRISGKDPGPKIKIGTTGLTQVQKWDNGWIPVTEDTADEITMLKPDPTKDVWLSEPMILADGDDDSSYKPGGTENQPDDPTHAAGLDSTVKVTLPSLNNLEATKQTIKARYEVQVRNLVFSPEAIPALQTTQIANQIQHSRDVYRPHAFTFNYSGLQLFQNAEISSLIETIDDKDTLRLDTLPLRDKFGKALKDSGATIDSITVIWFPSVTELKPPLGSGSHAQGFTGLYKDAANQIYRWIAIPCTEHYPVTLAHEIGHTLELPHKTTKSVAHLVMSGSTSSTILIHTYNSDKKRLYFDESKADENLSNEGHSIHYWAESLPFCKPLK